MGMNDTGHTEILPQTEEAADAAAGTSTPQRRRSGRNRIICVLIILVLLLALIVVLCLTINARVVLTVYPEQVIVPETDKRKYRVIELTNSIKVTLVSDSNSPTASTSYNVAVGSLANPDDVLGLAHYLEHMLFMGTKKYPRENTADSTATKFDGWINAYTDDLNTNYYFSVENSGLKNMSDIYAQFFIEPLFNSSSLGREMLAVDSEYKMGFSDDFWPFYELMTSLSNPESPHSRFSTGSLSTLNKTDIRERLQEFYDRYYSANLITIAMVGNQTLDTLQDWAEELFTSIPNKKRARPTYDTLPFPPGNRKYICRRIFFIPKTDKDMLKIMFPVNIPNQPNLNFVIYTLGYEGKGSLYQYLSKKGYITSLNTLVSIEGENFMALAVYMELTELGLRQPKFIIEALFKYVKRFNENGIDRQLWEENKKIDDFKFKFKENDEANKLASTLAARMAIKDDPKDYLDPPSRRLFNQTLETEIVNHISPENFNYYICSQKLSTEQKNIYGPQLTENEDWYNTPYANLEITSHDIETWKSVEVDEELKLPETNVFVPENFELVNPAEAKSLPVVLNDTDPVKLWWYLDTEFSQPKINMGCRIHPVPKAPSVRGEILARLLSSMYSQESAESLYPALMVDFDIQLMFSDYWIAQIRGFSDPNKVKEVINKALDLLFQLDFAQPEDHFNATVVEPLRKYYQNTATLMPAKLARVFSKMLQDEYMYSFHKSIEVLDTITQSDIKSYRDDFLKDITIDCLAMGNVLSEQASEYSNILQSKLSTLGKAEIVAGDRLKSFLYPALKIKNGTNYVIRRKVLNLEDPNSGALVQYQIGLMYSNGPYTDRKPFYRYALVRLLGLAMKERCFNYLRTQQQLGYLASCFEEAYKDILIYNILVQGSRADKGAEVMAEEIDKFVQLTYDEFSNMPQDTIDKFFGGIKIAMKKQLEDQPISMSLKYDRYALEIFRGMPDFERRAKQSAAIDDITFDDFLEFYYRYLVGGSRRKISTRVFGKDDTIPNVGGDSGNSGGDYILDDEVIVDDVVQFREKHLSGKFGRED